MTTKEKVEALRAKLSKTLTQEQMVSIETYEQVFRDRVAEYGTAGLIALVLVASEFIPE